MKQYEITYTMKFDLPAPNAVVILDDVNRIIAKELNIECSMIDIHVKEIEEDKIVNLTPKDSE